MIDHDQLKQFAKQAIEKELASLAKLSNQINGAFVKACEILLACQGRIIVIGMGKSGHIARKIAATLASTGSPAQFVHAGEANHGDLGMITKTDAVIALSNSGNTAEVINLLPNLKRLGVPIISLCCRPNSQLAKHANINLHIPIEQEACPHNLAPTSSTTAMLVMGDAIAVTLLQAKQFTRQDFAFSHPCGSLGRQLLLTVGEIMHKDKAIPMVNLHASLKDTVVEMTSKRLGFTTIINDTGKIIGIFTDGDLRRALEQHQNLNDIKIQDIMTIKYRTISPEPN